MIGLVFTFLDRRGKIARSRVNVDNTSSSIDNKILGGVTDGELICNTGLSALVEVSSIIMLTLVIFPVVTVSINLYFPLLI